MMLNKEECEKALEVLECKAYDGCDKCYSQDEELCKKREDKDFVEADIIKQLIEENFELVENYNKLTDLNNMSEHQLLAFNTLANAQIKDRKCDLCLYKMSNDIQNPQPYKFEDLKEGMWIWDDVFKEIGYIYSIANKKEIYIEYLESHCANNHYQIQPFEENRFYPVTKAMQYQEELLSRKEDKNE